MQGLFNRYLLLLMMMAVPSFSGIIGINNSNETPAQGSKITLDVQVSGLSLGNQGEIKDIFIINDYDMARVYPSKVTIVDLSNLSIDFELPYFVSTEEFQNWKLEIETESSGYINQYFNLAVQPGVKHPYASQVIRTSSANSSSIDTGNVAQVFQIHLENTDANTHTNWSIGLSSNGVSKILLNNVQVVSPSIIQGEINYVSLIERYPNFYIQSDQLPTQVIPRALAEESISQPYVQKVQVNGGDKSILGFAQDYSFNVTMGNIDFNNTTINHVQLLHGNSNFYVNSVNVVNSSEIQFDLTTNYASTLGPLRFELNTSEHGVSQHQTIAWLGEPPTIANHNFGDNGTKFFVEESNVLGLKFNNIDLNNFTPEELQVSLRDSRFHHIYADQVQIISQDSLVATFNNGHGMYFGYGDIEIMAGSLPQIVEKSSFSIESKGPPFLNSVLLDPINQEIEFSFSTEILANSIAANSMLDVEFGVGNNKQVQNFDLNRLAGLGDGQVFVLALTAAEVNSIVNAVKETGTFGRLSANANLFQAKGDLTWNELMEKEKEHFLSVDFEYDNGDFFLNEYGAANLDFLTDTLMVNFNVFNLDGITTNVAKEISIIVENELSVDTLTLNNLLLKAVVEANNLKVDISSISSTLKSKVDKNTRLHLLVDPGVALSGGFTNIRVVKNIEFYDPNFPNSNNEIYITNGPLWFSHSHLNLEYNNFNLDFNNVPDSLHAKDKEIGIVFNYRDGSRDTTMILVDNASHWNTNFMGNGMSGTLEVTKFNELKSKVKNGVHLNLISIANNFRSDVDVSNLTPEYTNADNFHVSLDPGALLIEGADFQNDNTQLQIQFRDDVSLRNGVSGAPISIHVKSSQGVYTEFPLDLAAQDYQYDGSTLRINVVPAITDAIDNSVKFGTGEVYLSVLPNSFEDPRANATPELLLSEDFLVYPQSDHITMEDFQVAGYSYNLIENRITVITNTNLDNTYQPSGSVTLSIDNPLTNENFNLSFNANMEYDPEHPYAASFVLPRIQARNLERTYGFLEQVAIRLNFDAVQSADGRSVVNNHFHHLATSSSESHDNVVKRAQLNTDNMHLSVYFNHDVKDDQSPFLNGGSVSNIILGISTDVGDGSEIFIDPEMLVVSSKPDQSQADNDRELVIDLSSHEAKINGWEPNWDRLFLYIDSNNIVFEDKSEAGVDSTFTDEVLANITLTNNNIQSEILSVGLDNQTLRIEYSGVTSPDFDERNIGLVSESSAGDFEFKSIEELQASRFFTSGAIEYTFAKDPKEYFTGTSVKMFVYIGTSNFVGGNPVLGDPNFGWNLASITELIEPDNGEVEAPVITINYLTEQTNEVIPPTVVYSLSKDFRDSIRGQGVPIAIVPNRTLFFKFMNTPGEILELRAPARPSISLNQIGYPEIQAYKLLKEFEWDVNYLGQWVSGSDEVILLDENSDDLRYRKPATSSQFASEIGILKFQDKAMYWNPSLIQQGTAIQFTWVANATKSVLDSVQYEFIIQGNSLVDTLTSSRVQTEYWPLPVGEFKAIYTLSNQAGVLIKKDSVQFVVTDEVKYTPSFDFDNESLWYMVGFGDDSQSIKDVLAGDITAFRWIDDSVEDELYGKYVFLDVESKVNSGEGFWIYNADSSDYNFKALSDDVREVTVSTFFDEEGWQQITNPWSYPIEVSAVRAGGSPVELWSWDPVTSDFQIVIDRLLPGIGYFTQVKDNEDITIEAIPWFPEAQNVHSAITGTAGSSTDYLSKELSVDQVGDWKVQLAMTSGSKEDQLNIIGVQSNSGYQIQERPDGFGERVRLEFEGDLSADVRVAGQDTYHWVAQVNSSVNGRSQAALVSNGVDLARLNGYQLFYSMGGEWKVMQDTNYIQVGAEEQKVYIQATKSSSPEALKLGSSMGINLKGGLVYDVLNVDVQLREGQSHYQWSILNPKGEEVFSQKVENNPTLKVNLSSDIGLDEGGVYLLRVQSGSETQAQRFTYLPR